MCRSPGNQSGAGHPLIGALRPQGDGDGGPPVFERQRRGYSGGMRKARSSTLGGVLGAAAGVVLAPRLGESRRQALDRLRLVVRPGRGALRAFEGTPCAAERRASATGQGGAARAADAAPAAMREGEHDG